ncbi:AAC(3) family N-acetyltransferase [Levilactobacillus brevis]|uniref:AAC(3) family N-acetyltransferase n=1 Tax=Levilactobacillus brevis TaxID=1580 RepID=UPI001BAAB6F9|nr:AAC(3) family N-acetyltransferase [Levilactobacillus brevis]MBS1011933.1 AAC(3) family N-acetyltransferase [Levilactobacillus brevis]
MTNWQEREITRVTTAIDLYDLFDRLGLRATDSCLVHTSLSAFGYIPGGGADVGDGAQNDLVSRQYCDAGPVGRLYRPTRMAVSPVRQDLQAKVMAGMPAYDRTLTPCHFIGITPEYFRTLPDTQRSGHPTCSMTAWGRNAAQICATPTLDLPFGAQGPLQKLYDLNAKVVCLGTDFETATANHLAESTIGRPVFEEQAPISVAGKPQWRSYQMVELEPYDDFNVMGAAFCQAHPEQVTQQPLGQHHQARALGMRALVDFAREYYRKKIDAR